MERSISARGPTQIRRSIFDKQVHCPTSFHLCTKFRKGIKNGKSLIPLRSPRLIRKCHSAWESHEVVNTIHKATRNTSGYLSLEFHFHTDTRVRIWPLGSDWLISLQTRKSIWLVCFIGNTERMVGISVYPIHTEIFAPKINELNFIHGRTVFVTSEKYRPTNHRPRTALCH